MWTEQLKDGRFKYVERYRDPYTEKLKKKSIILTSDSPQAWKKAQKALDEKISESLNEKRIEKIPFQKVYMEWENNYKKKLRPNSINGYIAIRKIIFKSIDKDVLISNIDTPLLQKFFSELDYSDDYTSHIKSNFNLVFKYAKKMGYVENNPVENVEIVYKAKTLEDFERIENKYLEMDEVNSLLKELYKSRLTYRSARLAEFMYLTGTRFGEAVALREENFDLDKRVVYIRGTIDYSKGYARKKIGPPKTIKSNRDIELTPRTIELVKRTIEENNLEFNQDNQFSNDDFLFVTWRGIPIQNSSFNRTLTRAGERLKINKKITSHILRHTHISILAEQNVPLKAIMERVGHSDADITNSIYTHVTNKMRTDLIAKLELSGL